MREFKCGDIVLPIEDLASRYLQENVCYVITTVEGCAGAGIRVCEKCPMQHVAVKPLGNIGMPIRNNCAYRFRKVGEMANGKPDYQTKTI